MSWGDAFKKAILGDQINDLLETRKRVDANVDDFKRTAAARKAGEQKIFDIYVGGLTHNFDEFAGALCERHLDPLQPYCDEEEVAEPISILRSMLLERRGPQTNVELVALRRVIEILSEVQMGVWGDATYEQLKRAHLPPKAELPPSMPPLPKLPTSMPPLPSHTSVESITVSDAPRAGSATRASPRAR